jgi:predicted nucleotidyltransferase
MLKFHEEILKEFEPVGKKAKIILFGSIARGNYRLDSDIDLAIITKDKKLVELAQSIADKIQKHRRIFEESSRIRRRKALA